MGKRAFNQINKKTKEKTGAPLFVHEKDYTEAARARKEFKQTGKQTFKSSVDKPTPVNNSVFGQAQRKVEQATGTPLFETDKKLKKQGQTSKRTKFLTRAR